jgi:hypothetical protein
MIEPNDADLNSSGPDDAQRARPSDVLDQLLFTSFPYFMSQLFDADGLPLDVAEHHQSWCSLIAEHPRLVLLAPRDHSKTTTALAFVLWQSYRHGTDPTTGRPRSKPAGIYQAALFSATHAQARMLMALFRQLVDANAWLFPDILDLAGGLGPRTGASDTRVRLASGAELHIRAFGTSTRGLHPDLLVLDDVLSDQNSGSEFQRAKTWRYFVRTLLPMHAARILVVGTTLHAADLLQRLKPTDRRVGRVHDFEWRRFRAINDATGRALWPERHPFEELTHIRDLEPVMFSAEYQNDPQDEIATFFPRTLTQLAVDAGANLTLLPFYRKRPGEWVVLGADPARSEAIGADYTAVEVVVYDQATRERRVIATRRIRGLDFQGQIAMFLDLSVTYGVDIGFVEANGFQQWLIDELRHRPGGEVYFGHVTGRDRMSFDRAGIPMLKLPLVNGLWVVPSGDERSRALARQWQAELAAFTWRDGRAQGVGEHDDLVIASWYVELAIRHIVEAIENPDADRIYYMEDLIPGWQPVRIGTDY